MTESNIGFSNTDIESPLGELIKHVSRAPISIALHYSGRCAGLPTGVFSRLQLYDFVIIENSMCPSHC